MFRAVTRVDYHKQFTIWTIFPVFVQLKIRCISVELPLGGSYYVSQEKCYVEMAGSVDNTPQYFNKPGTSLRAHLNVTSRVLAILPQSGSR